MRLRILPQKTFLRMSDSESGDGMDELQAILDEYSAKESKESKSKSSTNSTAKSETNEWLKSEEEIRLEKLIFGDKEGLLENLKKSTSDGEEDKNDDEIEEPVTKKRKPAWEDEDDEIKLGELYGKPVKADKSLKEKLKSRHERLFKTPKWADLDRKRDDDDSDNEILQTVGFIARHNSETLEPQNIFIKRLRDLNRAKMCSGGVRNVQFHPTSTVGMVSSSKGIATLFAVDGAKNDKLHSISFNNFNIKCSRILNCGTQALFTGGYSHYYTYDLMQATEIRHQTHSKLLTLANFEISPNGKYFAASGLSGQMHLFDMKCKELIHTFKQEDNVQAMRFSLDSNKIIASSDGSSVSIFDVRQQRMMHSFLDDGCIHGCSLAVSPNEKMLATGSSEGAVNIYDYDQVFLSKAPRPEKTLLNLTTAVTHLNFNHSSEILGMCSKMVKSAVRLVHFPTGTVFANFPVNPQTDLGHVKEVQFSPSSGYMALAMGANNAPLYRLKHFKNY